MKKVAVIVLIGIFGSILMYSCNSSTSGSSKAAAEDQNKQTMTTASSKDDAQLIVDLVAAQYDEIRLSKYALVKSTNQDIKDVSQMMVTDHSAFLKGLTSLAAKKNISVPNEDSAKVNSKINSWKDKKEADFNKAWTSDMISAHKDAIDKIQKALDNTNTDTDIKELLNSTLPTVRKHLDMLNQENDRLSKMKS